MLEIQKLLMSGARVHLESTLNEQRHIGMAVAECVFNKLNPIDDEEHRLKFEYEVNDDVTGLKQLARPVAEQEAELKEWRERNKIVTNDRSRQEQPRNVGVARSVVRKEREEDRFGDGMVEATECSDTDRSANFFTPAVSKLLPIYIAICSDDDLLPYAMSEDPDASVPKPPRYLRTLLQGTGQIIGNTEAYMLHTRNCMQ